MFVGIVYFNIMKNCTQDETCYKCVASLKHLNIGKEETYKLYLKFKHTTYLKVNNEHDALDPQCPTFRRTIQEERKRAGWEDTK